MTIPQLVFRDSRLRRSSNNDGGGAVSCANAAATTDVNESSIVRVSSQLELQVLFVYE
ncbi:MAG: hypothetical protein MHMPM18_002985 [Marteilia pararefringens]